MSGGLPLVHIRLSDQKIKAIFDLIDSIPLPQKSSMSVPSKKVSWLQARKLKKHPNKQKKSLMSSLTYHQNIQVFLKQVVVPLSLSLVSVQVLAGLTLPKSVGKAFIISKKNINIPSYRNFKILFWSFFSFLSLQVPAIPTIPAVGKGLLNTPQLLAEIVSGKKLQMCLRKIRP